jgi:hypothetical protein
MKYSSTSPLSIRFIYESIIEFFLFYLDNHYNLPSGQLPMTNTNMFYPPHQQSTPAVNDQKSEQQLIIFD